MSALHVEQAERADREWTSNAGTRTKHHRPFQKLGFFRFRLPCTKMISCAARKSGTPVPSDKKGLFHVKRAECASCLFHVKRAVCQLDKNYPSPFHVKRGSFGGTGWYIAQSWIGFNPEG